MKHKIVHLLTALLALLLLLSACQQATAYYDSPEAVAAATLLGYEDVPLVDETWISEPWLSERYLALTYLDMEHEFTYLPESEEDNGEAEPQVFVEPLVVVLIMEEHAENRYSLAHFNRIGFGMNQDGTRAGGLSAFGTGIGETNLLISYLILDTNFEAPDPQFDLSKLREVQPGVYFAIEANANLEEMIRHYCND